MKSVAYLPDEGDTRRPPRGGRGLKYPAGGQATRLKSRPPRGGRGLKWIVKEVFRVAVDRRPPRGGRGLKYKLLQDDAELKRSPPSRGAWIEI